MASAASLDAICTCKVCNHDLAKDCGDAKCSCCQARDHAMIMDGIEGFGPKEHKTRWPD